MAKSTKSSSGGKSSFHSKRVSEVENRNFALGDEPAVVFVFSTPEADNFKMKREKAIDQLKEAGFLVGQAPSRDGDELFVKVAIPPSRMLREAEARKVQVRLKQIHGGALHEYNDAQRELFENCSEGTILSSAQQLIIIDALVRAKKNEKGAEIDINDLKEGKVLLDYFMLHYEPTRKRLEEEWAFAWVRPQPIELVREYFGEKAALYFTWLGHYTTMLWVPALAGVMMTISQLYTSIYTGSMDNPWVPCYCAFLALWAVAFLETWKQIEETKKIEWQTGNFEDEEEDREEFTPTDKRRDRIKEAIVEYYPDWKRNLRICLSTVVVLSFISMVVCVVVCLMVAKYALTLWFGKVGAAIGSALNAASIMIFNELYGKIVNLLNDQENWRTETQYEDALIAKDFCFKFINSYFALFFVAYIQNSFVLFGYDLHCPEYECMPVLTMTLGVVFGTQIFVQQAMEIGMPIIQHKWEVYQEEKAMRDRGEEVVPPSKEEEQSKMEEYEGVFDDYNEMVVQFGYVTLFAAAFPPAATLALVNNITEIRIDAMKMVTATKRAEYLVASDIGTWMTILEIMTVVAIMTNVTVVGFTSNGLYYYFPDITPLEKIWVVVIIEHILFGLKIGVELAIHGPPESAEIEQAAKEHFKEKALKTWARKQAQLEDDDDEDDMGGGGGSVDGDVK